MSAVSVVSVSGLLEEGHVIKKELSATLLGDISNNPKP